MQNPQEIFYYAGKAKEVAHEDTTADSMALQGEAAPDEQTLNDLTQEGGPLHAGAMPAADVAVAEGEKALWEAMGAQAMQKTKTPKPKPEAAEELVPKTVKERLD
eukprot:s2526_g24.t1